MIMATSVSSDLLQYLLDLARSRSLSTGDNDLGNHNIPENGGYHARVRVKVNSQGDITDFILVPVSNNPRGAHDHIWGVNTGNPMREERTTYDW
jgi:hypothetical protein